MTRVKAQTRHVMVMAETIGGDNLKVPTNK